MLACSVPIRRADKVAPPRSVTPNGEFSVVSAKTKSDAIELLDEWGKR
jgi:hypothetical protein